MNVHRNQHGRARARLLLCGLVSLLAFLPQAHADDGSAPTEGELRQIVRRLLGAKYDSNQCGAVEQGHGHSKSYVIECRETECRSCAVTKVVTTLSRKNGKWIVAGTRRERHGDTGECGCCMLND